MTKKHTRIAIIGAGLIGRLCALSLVKQGFSITLFDKDNRLAHNSAAYAAAGLLTPLGEAMHSEANIVEMGFESLKLWPQLLASLSGYTYFQQSGSLMVAHEQDQSDFNRFTRYISNHYPQYKMQHLNRQQLLDLEPELGRNFNQGLLLPQEGQLSNRQLLVALTEELESTKVTWLSETQVTEITSLTNGCSITTNDQSMHFDLTIDCRGSGARIGDSTDKAQPLSDLRGVRGELFQLFAPEVNLSRPIRLIHPRYQLYIAPKTKGFYIVGATEIESDDQSPMTVRSAMELLSAAYSVHPGFAEANIRQHITQLRPAFSDNQPRILTQSGLIQVNGLFRHGFLIAPVVLAQLEHTVKVQLGEDSQAPYSHLLPISFAHEHIH